ncbi:uncharacterized protein LOC126817682 isoform X2 [Patella vulgata]|uniref:uncharacterized protein LOC126817682 isoform X2 n=1 Tax=Patella vulgata TaxID=6465 RepID=UPI0024A7E679|nr:uncharacterized protein LOC126817682 isoform X2 [Patella vulgata]
MLFHQSGLDVSNNVTSIRGYPKDNITFIWKYNNTEPIHMIIFNRKKEKNGKLNHLGVWEDSIFNRNASSVKVSVRFNKTGDLEGIIYLTLLDTTSGDYNLNYTCRIVFNDKKSSSIIGIFLAGGPDVSSNVANMSGYPNDNITFIWNYYYTVEINMITFNRKNEKNGKLNPLGVWEDGIFNRNASSVKVRVMFNKTGDWEGVIYLTLLNTTAGDYNLNYTCKVVFNDKKSSSSIGIFLAGGPDVSSNVTNSSDPGVSSNVTNMSGHPKDNITFIWNYNYTESIDMIIFNRKNEKGGKIDKIGYWQGGNFLPTIPDGESRLTFNKTERNITNGIEGQIILTLLNASREDFNYFYICRIIFHDKEESSWGILLKEKVFVQDISGLSSWEIVGITVAVVFLVVIVIVIVIIVLVKRYDSVRQKIKCCIGENNTDTKEGNNTTDQQETIPLNEL